MSSAPHSIGVTGGIGSGKSTVAGFLGNCGATVIDADALSRELTSPGGRAIPAIEAAFGRAMIDTQGGLDRAAMRQLVFADACARLRLESLVHPLIWQEIDRRRDSARAAGVRLLVFDVPLLVEMQRWRPLLDTVLVVDCSPATQRSRVMARNGMDAAEVQRIMDAQAARGLRLACADHVLFNEGICLSELRRQSEQFLGALRI